MATVATQLNSGSGFASGEVVTATKLNSLVNSSTVTGIQTSDISDLQVTTGKLADSSATTEKIADSAITTAKIASDAVTLAKLSLPTGFPIQVVQAVKTGTQQISLGATWTDVSDLSLTITRADTAGKVRVQAMIHGSPGGYELFFRIMRGATPIGVPTGVGSRAAVTATLNYFNTSTGSATIPIDFIDDVSAISTSSLTYKIQAYAYQGNIYANWINKAASDADDGSRMRAISTLTLTELAS